MKHFQFSHQGELLSMCDGLVRKIKSMEHNVGRSLWFILRSCSSSLKNCDLAILRLLESQILVDFNEFLKWILVILRKNILYETHLSAHKSSHRDRRSTFRMKIFRNSRFYFIWSLRAVDSNWTKEENFVELHQINSFFETRVFISYKLVLFPQRYFSYYG